MKNITLGSLFDGSGGFPLAGILNGITPLWASEIEPFPIRVTAKRIPTMKHYGDVQKINGAKLEPVDIITFGSPCQDMSIAGKRSGIHDGERSNLFFEAIRIIREMRGITNGKYPRYAVWENVPGAYSSNKGDDFRCILEAFCQISDESVSIPMPKNGTVQDLSGGMGTAWHGECSTRNTGESPSVAVESTLSQILEVNAPTKYYLSAKACQGILNRVARRGKALPPMLREALEEAVMLGS